MLAVILGTRPELIKCAPVILEAQRRGIPVGIIHTGQHYSHELDGVFFDELNLPKPVAHVHVGSHSAPKQIGLMVCRVAEVFEELSCKMALVQGDTNTVLAGALAAYKSGIPVAHLEAGLRSDDWSMPEESNRVLADRISKWLFCPTENQRERLLREGIDHDGVHVVGNTVVDAALHYVKISYEKSDIAERLKLLQSDYGVLTMHRPGNVDDPNRLRTTLDLIARASSHYGLKIVFPIHPRTKKVIIDHGIRLPDHFIATEPLGYLDLLRLQASAQIILTDSGGIQEEACILRVPSITLRPNTERPETLHVGASVLCHGSDQDRMIEVMQERLTKDRSWQNPFGDGKTAERVLDILSRS